MQNNKLIVGLIAAIISTASALATRVSGKLSSGNLFYIDSNINCVIDSTCKAESGPGGSCDLIVEMYTNPQCTSEYIGARHHVDD